MSEIMQGDVHWAELPVEGMGKYVQRFRRPYLVVSNDFCNKSSPNVTVVPLTTSTGKRCLPTHVLVSMYGKPNVIECEQPMTIGKELLEGKVHYRMSKEKMEEVNAAMAIHFQLDGGRYEG